MIKTKQTVLLSILLILAAVILYYPSLNYYFFQDDFYTLLKSQAQTVTEFLQFFVPGVEIYYRPLSMRVYFWLVQLVFGLNPFVFHLISLGIHLTNSFLVWRFVAKLVKSQIIGWIAAFLFATSSLHFINLYWISETGLLLGISFYLLASLEYLQWLEKKPSGYSIILFLLFVAGILSHEYMFTFPTILIAMWFYKRTTDDSKPNLKKLLIPLLPIILICMVYATIRLVIFPIQVSGTYTVMFGKATVKGIFWYGLWSLNVLENFIDQLEPGVKLRSDFLYTFPIVSLTTVAILILATLFIVGAPAALIVQADKILKKRILKICIFSLAWITITLSLPLLAPAHIHPIYASLAFVGVATIIATFFWLLYPKRNIAISVFLIIWFSHSLQTIRLTEKIHWTGQEARKAEQIVTRALTRYPHIPSGSTFVIRNDAQTRQALFEDVGLKLIYDDQTLNTYYGDAFDILPPACVNKTKPEIYLCLREYNIFVP